MEFLYIWHSIQMNGRLYVIHQKALLYRGICNANRFYFWKNINIEFIQIENEEVEKNYWKMLDVRQYERRPCLITFYFFRSFIYLYSVVHSTIAFRIFIYDFDLQCNKIDSIPLVCTLRSGNMCSLCYHSRRILQAIESIIK